MNYIVLEQEENDNDSNIYLLNKRKSEHIRNILKKTAPGCKFKALKIGIARGSIELLAWDGDLARVQFSPEPRNSYFEIFRHSISLFLPLPRPQTGKKILHLCGCFGIENVYMYADKHNKEYLTSPVYNDSWKEYWLSGIEQTGSIEKLNMTIVSHSPKWNEIEMVDFSKSRNYCLHPNSDKPITEVFLCKDASFLESNRNNDIAPVIVENLPTRINLFLGSESGYKQNELDSIASIPNMSFLNLGKIILRTEYALSSALFLIRNCPTNSHA